MYQFLVFCGAAGAAVLWFAMKEQISAVDIAWLLSRERMVYAAHFSPDGHRIVTTSFAYLK